MVQSMLHEVLDAMDQADLELRGYHSKCYRGLRARGEDPRSLGRGPRRVVPDDARKRTD